MKFTKLLPHLVGAIAILNAPAMVSPLSNADIARMESAAQDFTRLRDFPNVMSPTELAAWRKQALTWIDNWINFLESIDLEAMTNSRDEFRSLHARINLTLILHLTHVIEMESILERSPDSNVLRIAYHIGEACNKFDFDIVPPGMAGDRIVDQLAEGGLLSVAGMAHSFSVNQYYYLNHNSPKW